jgi:hypothetical protein
MGQDEQLATLCGGNDGFHERGKQVRMETRLGFVEDEDRRWSWREQSRKQAQISGKVTELRRRRPTRVYASVAVGHEGWQVA